MLLDVYRPIDTSLGIAVVLIHGGGWASLHRSDMDIYAKRLVRSGFLAIAAEYCLLSEAPWPAALDDVRDVVR